MVGPDREPVVLVCMSFLSVKRPETKYRGGQDIATALVWIDAVVSIDVINLLCPKIDGLGTAVSPFSVCVIVIAVNDSA